MQQRLSPDALAKAKDLVDQLKPAFQESERAKDIAFDDEREVVVFTLNDDKDIELEADRFLALYA